MYKTIKQLADELGVSKTAVRNYMDDDFRAKYTEKNSKGVITISADGCKVIAESIEKFVENSENHFAESGENLETITIPKSVFAMMEKQIVELQNDLRIEREHSRKLSDDISKLADQSQQLHLQAEQKQLLEAPSQKSGGFFDKIFNKNKE